MTPDTKFTLTKADRKFIRLKVKSLIQKFEASIAAGGRGLRSTFRADESQFLAIARQLDQLHVDYQASYIGHKQKAFIILYHDRHQRTKS